MTPDTDQPPHRPRPAMLWLYSALFVQIAHLVRFASRFHHRLHSQVTQRPTAAQLAPLLAQRRAKYREAVLFFCSSAGEFEQARPLIDRLMASQQVFVHVVFFSRSGLAFAQARGEPVSYCLSPLSDAAAEWQAFFAALRPAVTCVVRHELWPGFLATAQLYGKLFLIDAGTTAARRPDLIKRCLRSFLLNMFDGIYTVTAGDRDLFAKHYAVPTARLTVMGDTKYDRVLERARDKAVQVSNLKVIFDDLAKPGSSRRLVVGSAYQDEITLLLAAYRLRAAQLPAWQIIIVPHHIDGTFVQSTKQQCIGAGLSTVLYSELPSAKAAGVDVIIVDVLGILSEIYGTATAALVGGALHHQVHNVLEPASHGLALAFGPFYKNSQEAVHLVAAGLADVIVDVDALAAWWERLGTHRSEQATQMKAAVAALGGASDRMMAAWQPQLRI